MNSKIVSQDEIDADLKWCHVTFELPIKSHPHNRSGKRAVNLVRGVASRVLEIRHLKPFTGPVHMTVHLRFNPIDFEDVLQLKRDGVTSRIIGDVDNHAKTILDALCGYLYVDDSLVVDLRITKEMVNVESSYIQIDVAGTYRKD